MISVKCETGNKVSWTGANFENKRVLNYFLSCSFLLFISMAFVARISAQAPEYLWAKSTIENATERIVSVAADTANNLFATGYYDGPSLNLESTTLNNSGGHDFFLAKYSPEGTLLWARTSVCTGYDEAFDVTVDQNGCAYVIGFYTGSSIAFGTNVLSNVGDDDTFIVKYDPDGNVLWAKSIGGPLDDRGVGISTDLFGNVFATGQFGSPSLDFGNTSITNLGSVNSDDLFVVKFDTSGNDIWSHSEGGTGTQRAKAITTDYNGNVLLTGEFRSVSLTLGTTTLTNSSFTGQSDIFLMKYDNSGNVIWAKSEVGAKSEVSSCIATDLWNNVLITGYFYSPSMTFNNEIVIPNQQADLSHQEYYVAKYDSNGNFLWVENSPGDDSENANDAAADNNGNFFVNIIFTSDTIAIGTDTLYNPNYSSNTALIKYDSNGNIVWVKAAQGNGYDVYSGVCTDAMGNAIVGGYFEGGYITIGDTTFTNTDPDYSSNLLLIKLSATLSAAAVSTDVSCFGENDGAATATVLGGVPPYTYLWSNDLTDSLATGLFAGDYSVVVIDNLGDTAIAYVTVMEPTNMNVEITSVSVTSCPTCCDGTATASVDGGVPPYVYSWSTLPEQSGLTATGLCADSTYYFLATDANGCISNTISAQIFTTVEQMENQRPLRLYPNPTNEYFFLDLPSYLKGQMLTLQIISNDGSTCRLQKSSSGYLNISDLASGLYTIKVSDTSTYVGSCLLVVE
jgi:hypothetical protein